MKSTFKFKILAIMLMTIMVPIIFLTFFVTYSSESYYEKFIPNYTRNNVQKDLSEIEAFFIQEEHSLKNLSERLSLQEDGSYIYSVLDHFMAEHPSFLNAYYTKEIGEDFANGFGETPVDGRSRPWYKDAVANQGFTISSPYIDVITKEYVITLSVPVYREKSLLGVFGVDFLIEDVIKNAKTLTRLKGVSYILVKPSGEMVYYDTSHFDNQASAQAALDGEDHDQDYQVKSFTLDEIKLTSYILFYSDDYQINKSKIGSELSLLFLLVILIAVMFAMKGSKKMSEPLRVFKDSIDAPALDTKGHGDIIWDAEFDLLFEKFNGLARKISQEKINLSNRVKELQEKNSSLMEKNMALEFVYSNLKQLDKKVRKSKNDYESILDNVKGMIWVLDHTGKIVFANQELTNHLGYKGDALTNLALDKLIVNNYKDHFDILEVIKSRDFNKIEMTLLHQEGQGVLVEANTSRINDDQGHLLYVYGICRNVREIKKLLYDYSVKIQEQNLMMDLTETASMNVSMVQVIKVIFEKINSIFGWSVGTIRFLNENNAFDLVARTDVGSEYIVANPIPNKGTCLSYVVESNKILYAKKHDDLPYFEDIYGQMIDNGYVIIFIPVGNAEIGMGVISLVIDQVAMVEKEDILKSFTNTILLVVERALVYEKLKNDYIRMIKVLAEAGDDKDSSSVGHSNRVAAYAKKIGEHLYLDDDEIVDLEICGLLHDIGKIGISDEFLKGKDYESIEKVKEHPSVGKHMLKDIGLAQSILEGIEMHHLNFDLSGYPKIDFVESLPLFARIIQVADGFDNLKETRAIETDIKIFDQMSKDVGHIYCPQVMRVFKAIINNEELGV